jgi:hypothetical protein
VPINLCARPGAFLYLDYGQPSLQTRTRTWSIPFPVCAARQKNSTLLRITPSGM